MKEAGANAFANAFAGAFAGATQVVMGYPFETVKVWRQTNPRLTSVVATRQIFKTNGVAGFYQGVQAPVCVKSMKRAIQLPIFQYVVANQITNPYLAGGMAGLAGSVVACPFNQLSTLRQTNRISSMWSTLVQERFRVMQSLKHQALRDGLFTGVYLGSYKDIRDVFGWPPWAAGGVAGCLSWTLCYPTDTLLVRCQARTFVKEHRPVVSSTPSPFFIASSFRGLPLMWVRCLVANGGSMFVYDMLTNNPQ
jgi:hypothetical protein